MNSSKTYYIIQLAQKYVIDEYLSFNVLSVELARGDATTQNFYLNRKSGSGCPYDPCFKSTVLCTTKARTDDAQ